MVGNLENLDNAGSGFALQDEDDDDINVLLAEARLHEEQDEDDVAITKQFFTPTEAAPAPERTPGSVASTEPRFTMEEDNEDTKFMEDLVATVPQEDPQSVTDVQPLEAPEAIPTFEEPTPQEVMEEAHPAPEVEQDFHQGPTSEVTQEAPTFAAPSTPVPRDNANVIYTAPRVRVPSLTDDVQRVRQVIRILDAYRHLSMEEQGVAAQFITNGGEISDEGEFVVATINADRMLTVTMRALRESKNLDAVERAFYIIELPKDVMHALGSLLAVFTDVELNTNATTTQYARKLVSAIEELDSKSMKLVEATESVLSAAEEPQE